MGQTNTIGSHCTTVRRDASGRLSVVYHATEVVAANTDGTITLDSGGYRTVTTKTRMNQASQQYGLGFHVLQHKRTWFVETRSGRVLPFSDGMTFNPSAKEQP